MGAKEEVEIWKEEQKAIHLFDTLFELLFFQRSRLSLECEDLCDGLRKFFINLIATSPRTFSCIVRPNSNCTLEDMFEATKLHHQHINEEAALYIPRNCQKEVKLEFVYLNLPGKLTPQDIEIASWCCGFKRLADPYELGAAIEADPLNRKYDYVGTQWRNKEDKWCYIQFKSCLRMVFEERDPRYPNAPGYHVASDKCATIDYCNNKYDLKEICGVR